MTTKPPEKADALELLPCPFCGGDHLYVATIEGAPIELWAVTCVTCGGMITRATEAEAITAWNTRASPGSREAVLPSFEDAWAKYVAQGYQYGRDALENVEFGYRIASEELAALSPTAFIAESARNTSEAGAISRGEMLNRLATVLADNRLNIAGRSFGIASRDVLREIESWPGFAALTSTTGPVVDDGGEQMDADTPHEIAVSQEDKDRAAAALGWKSYGDAIDLGTSAERSTLRATAMRLARHRIASTRTPPDGEVGERLRETLGEAFEALIYIFECSDDEQASRVAKEAADKIEAALTDPPNLPPGD